MAEGRGRGTAVQRLRPLQEATFPGQTALYVQGTVIGQTALHVQGTATGQTALHVQGTAIFQDRPLFMCKVQL